MDLSLIFKAISFDADGTLIGTFPDAPRGFENFFLNVAKAHGKIIASDELKPILSRMKEELGRQRAQGFKPYTSEDHIRKLWLWYYEHVFAACQLPEPERLAQDMLDRFESGEFTGLYSDTRPCLEYFQSKKIPMVLISNYSSLLKKFLSKLDIEHYFTAILISGIEGCEKPDSHIFHHGAQRLGLKPQEILHVGNDMDEDYYGAINAGFQAVLLDRDSTHHDPSLRKIRSLLELT